jgi:GTP pyrophosphokinase
MRGREFRPRLSRTGCTDTNGESVMTTAPAGDQAKAKSGLAQLPATDAASWLAAVTPGRSQADADKLARAVETIEWCGAQDSGKAHAYRVSHILHDLQMDLDTVIAASLSVARIHAEKLEHERVERLFGARVGELVAASERLRTVPDLLSGPRDAEQLERMRSMFLTLVHDVRAALIALAEWLHKMRSGATLSEREREEAARIALDIFAPLASRLGVWQLKWELEDLAFRFLEPDVYKDIARQLAERRSDREAYVDRVVQRVEQELKDAQIPATVAGRPKHIYSIWRKMQAKSLRFHDLFDVRAVRVVTDSVAHCYAALGIVHGMWTHVPREFDDYIANAKANGYQSLHTAVVGPEDRTVEIQIRTAQMNQDAELGMAAHWRYKEGNDSPRGAEERLAWLRQALEWRTRATDGELWEQLRTELDDERVYALTPQGRVFDLPKGATAVDFAYRVHTDVGHRCRGARVDGHIVPLTRPLENGETIEIITANNARPSRDWLNPDLGYLATTRARAKVRHWFRRLDFAQNAQDGRELWERETKRLRLPDNELQALPARFSLANVDALFAAIGRGDVNLGQVVRAVRDLTGEMHQQSRPGTSTSQDQASPAPEFLVEGVGDLVVQVARCCAPVPPEAILGYITRGRGITVHRYDCPNALRLVGAEPQRVIDVQWGLGGARHTVSVLVKAYDRRGLLRDVSTVITNTHTDVRGMTSDTDEKSGVVTMRIRMDVADMPSLSRVIGRIAQIRNVFEALREA